MGRFAVLIFVLIGCSSSPTVTLTPVAILDSYSVGAQMLFILNPVENLKVNDEVNISTKIKGKKTTLGVCQISSVSEAQASCLLSQSKIKSHRSFVAEIIKKDKL